MDYEVTWHGASWRDIPPPPPAVVTEAQQRQRRAFQQRSDAFIRSQEAANSRKRAETTRAVVRAVSAAWQTFGQIAKQAGRSGSSTRTYLRALHAQGLVEIMSMADGGQGRPTKYYRRRVQAVAA